MFNLAINHVFNNKSEFNPEKDTVLSKIHKNVEILKEKENKKEMMFQMLVDSVDTNSPQNLNTQADKVNNLPAIDEFFG